MTIPGPIVMPYDGEIANWLCTDNDCIFDTIGQSWVHLPPMINFFAAQQYIVSQFPQIASCVPMPRGGGAPTVHVPVSQLTATITSVITKTGVYSPVLSSPPPASVGSSAQVLLPASGLAKTDHSTKSTQTSTLEPETDQDLPTRAPVTTKVLGSPASSPTTNSDVRTAGVVIPASQILDTTSEDLPRATRHVSTAEVTVVTNAESTSRSLTSIAVPGTDTTATLGVGNQDEHGSIASPTQRASPQPSAQSIQNGDTGAVSSAAQNSPASISWVSTIALIPLSSASDSPDSPPMSVAPSTMTLDSVSRYDIGAGQTVSASGLAVTHDGNYMSVSAGTPGTVLVSSPIPSVSHDSEYSQSSGAAPAPAPVITVGTKTLTQNFASQYVVPSTIGSGDSDQTLYPGGPAVTDSGGTVYSIVPSGTAIVINEQTSAIITPAAALLTFVPAQFSSSGSSDGNNGNEAKVAAIIAIPIASSGEYFVVGQTISPGGSRITVSGATYSLAASNILVMNGMTLTPAAPASKSTSPSLPQDISSTSIIEFIIGDQTLRPGAPALKISSSTISLDAGGISVYINDIATPAPRPDSGSTSRVSIAGIAATPLDIPAYIIASSETLLPGGSAVVVSGTTYSAPPSISSLPSDPAISTSVAFGSEAVIVINGKTTTSPLPSGSPSTSGLNPSSERVQIISIGNSKITISRTVIQGSTDLVIGSQTLAPGAVITVAGSKISLAPDGNAVLVAAAAGRLESAENTETQTESQKGVQTGTLGNGDAVAEVTTSDVSSSRGMETSSGIGTSAASSSTDTAAATGASVSVAGGVRRGDLRVVASAGFAGFVLAVMAIL